MVTREEMDQAAEAVRIGIEDAHDEEEQARYEVRYHAGGQPYVEYYDRKAEALANAREIRRSECVRPSAVVVEDRKQLRIIYDARRGEKALRVNPRRPVFV